MVWTQSPSVCVCVLYRSMKHERTIKKDTAKCFSFCCSVIFWMYFFTVHDSLLSTCRWSNSVTCLRASVWINRLDSCEFPWSMTVVNHPSGPRSVSHKRHIIVMSNTYSEKTKAIWDNDDWCFVCSFVFSSWFLFKYRHSRKLQSKKIHFIRTATLLPTDFIFLLRNKSFKPLHYI